MSTPTLQSLDNLLRDRLRAEDVALVNSYISAIICEAIAAEREAVAAEREACARLADDPRALSGYNPTSGGGTGWAIAAAIRARGQL